MEHEYYSPAPAPVPAPAAGYTISIGGTPPLITQIWDGQVQAPTVVPVHPAPAPVPVPPAPAPIPVPVPVPMPVPSPAPGLPPLVSEIFDGQLQAPTETAVSPPMPSLPPLSTTPAVVPTPAPPAPPVPPPAPPVSASTLPTFQGMAGRIVVHWVAGWIVVAAIMGFVL